MAHKKPQYNLVVCIFLSLLYLETTFKILIFGIANLFNNAYLYIILFSAIFSLIITLLVRLFHYKSNRRITLTIICLICSWYTIEYMFKSIFNTFFSIYLFGLSDQAISFTKEAIAEVIKHIPIILLLFIPYILFLLFRQKINFHHPHKSKINIIDIITLIIFIILFIISINTNKTDVNSAYKLFYEIDNNAINVEKMGVGVSTYIDIKRRIFGFNEIIINNNTLEPSIDSTSNSVPDYNYNNLNINFDNISSSNKNIKNMSEYFKNDSGTLQNKYTNLYQGKNLIIIMGESLNTIAISEKYTPTLYKLSHEAFVFNNFYTPVNLSTIGGEFQNLTGLFANLSTLNNYWRKGSNSFPFGLGNVYKNLGYDTYAYHANYGTFQDRLVYLKNIGFDNFSYRGNGLENKMNCNLWPQSDLELVDATYNDWINSTNPFLAYYVSVSGHMPWSWNTNSMSKKNKELLNDSSYSEEASAYIAANIELDKSVEELINKLTAAGKLDDTVIAIVPDHYPYSMNLKTINELSDFKRDEIIGVNQSSLIIWNSTTENVQVDKVSTQLDFIPTIYNLFGVKYDSRLLMGKDILSSTNGLAYFTNRSWVTNIGKYYASTNTFINTSNEEVSQDYIDKINNTVENRINMSKLIMETNYYSYIKGDENDN